MQQLLSSTLQSEFQQLLVKWAALPANGNKLHNNNCQLPTRTMITHVIKAAGSTGNKMPATARGSERSWCCSRRRDRGRAATNVICVICETGPK